MFPDFVVSSEVHYSFCTWCSQVKVEVQVLIISRKVEATDGIEYSKKIYFCDHAFWKTGNVLEADHSVAGERRSEYR